MKNETRTGEFFGTGSDFPAWRSDDPPSDLQALHEELAVISDTDLETRIVQAKRHMDAVHARWLLDIAEYDRRQIADISHRLSTTGWLKSVLRLSGRVASTLVRQARGLLRMPEVAQAAIHGEVTPDAVAQLDRARRRHPDDFVHHAAVFADIATYLDPSELRQAIGHWEQQIDYPSAVARTKQQRGRRRLSITQLFDGMWLINGELDPETGAIVNQAVEQASRIGYLDGNDPRQPWQVRADALAGICEQSMRHLTATSKGVKPHITVTVDAATLLRIEDGLAAIDGAPIGHATLDRLVCDSSIIRILVDETGSPIDVGRATRVVPSGMRRALDARDRGCQWAGCDAPADWCDAHHIEHWADGGPTELENLVLLCRTHHTAIHDPNSSSTDLSPGHPETARAP